MSTITENKKLSYFREVQNELKKVSWTSREELIFCTKVVILATIFLGFAIYAVDLSIRGVLDLAESFMRAVFG